MLGHKVQRGIYSADSLIISSDLQIWSIAWLQASHPLVDCAAATVSSTVLPTSFWVVRPHSCAGRASAASWPVVCTAVSRTWECTRFQLSGEQIV